MRVVSVVGNRDTTTADNIYSNKTDTPYAKNPYAHTHKHTHTPSKSFASSS